MQLKDITKEWALEQLQSKYEEFNKVFIKSDHKVLESNPIELSMYDSGLTQGLRILLNTQTLRCYSNVHCTYDETLEKNYRLCLIS